MRIMPVSAMKFITVDSDGAGEYKLLCFTLGGTEEFFAKKGMSTEHGYVAAVILGVNPVLLFDTKFGCGQYGVERAGFLDYGDLMAAWEWILRHFETLPTTCVIRLKRSVNEYGWSVKNVEERD